MIIYSKDLYEITRKHIPNNFLIKTSINNDTFSLCIFCNCNGEEVGIYPLIKLKNNEPIKKDEFIEHLNKGVENINELVNNKKYYESK